MIRAASLGRLGVLARTAKTTHAPRSRSSRLRPAFQAEFDVLGDVLVVLPGVAERVVHAVGDLAGDLERPGPPIAPIFSGICSCTGRAKVNSPVY